MARRPRDHRLETREARARLKQSHEIYRRSLSPGLYIGYRKNQSGGVWYSIQYTNGRYKKRAIGYADDFTSTEEQSAERRDEFLSYGEAVNKIFSGIKDTRKRRGRWTVKDACESYLAWFKLNRRSYQQTEQAIKCHILPVLAELRLDELSHETISKWLNSIAQSAPRLRSTPLKTNYREIDANDEEALRKRKSTANRQLNTLKAVLNHAKRLKTVSSDEGWKDVQSFHDVDSQREVFLTDEECQQLLDSCEGALRHFVLGALLTGARPSELRQVINRDFYAGKALRIRASVSKTKRERIVPLNREGRELLSMLTAKRSAHEPIFTKEDGTAWGKNHHNRIFREAVEKAELPKDTVLYSLRHVFGNRHIENGTPVKSLSEIMGCSVRIVEKYYVKTSEKHLADMAENNSPRFGASGKVIPFPRVQRG